MEIMAEARDLAQLHKPLPGKGEVVSSISVQKIKRNRGRN